MKSIEQSQRELKKAGGNRNAEREERDGGNQNGEKIRTRAAVTFGAEERGTVSLKKFKTTEALVKAYNALEAEFTKRSQRLRELERRIAERKKEKEDSDERNDGIEASETEEKIEENEGADTEADEFETDGKDTDTEWFEAYGKSTEGENSGDGKRGIEASEAEDFEIDEKVEDGENSGDGKRGIEASENDRTPVWQRKDWEETVDRFVGLYPLAAGLARDIAAEIANDKNLTGENCLETAYTRVLERKYANPEGTNRLLEKYLEENPAVKDKIIAEYLEGLTKNDPPKLMWKGGASPVNPPHKPKNLTEAARLAKEMLK
jgi:hypothetical protein